MDHLDPQREAQVWARVRGEDQRPDPGQLQRLAATVLTGAGTYFLLSKSFTGQSRELLRQIGQRKTRQGQWLRGLYRLITGQPLFLRIPGATPVPPEQGLRRGYAQALEAMGEYETLTHHRQYGCVFARMLLQEQEHCLWLLEVLGGLGQQEPAVRGNS